MMSTNVVTHDPSPRRIEATSKRHSSLTIIERNVMDTAAGLMMYDIGGPGLPTGTDEPVLLEHEGLEYIPEVEEWHKPSLPPRSRCTAAKMWQALADGSATPNPTPPVPSTEVDPELVSNQSIAESLDGYSNADGIDEEVRPGLVGLVPVAANSPSRKPSVHHVVASGAKADEAASRSDDGGDVDDDVDPVGGGTEQVADDSISECMNSTFGEIPHFLELPLSEPSVAPTSAVAGAVAGPPIAAPAEVEVRESNAVTATETSAPKPPLLSSADSSPLRIDHTKHAMLYHDQFHNAAAFELQRRDILAHMKRQGGIGEETVVEDLLPDVDGYLLEVQPTQYNIGASIKAGSKLQSPVEEDSSSDATGSVDEDEENEEEAEEEEEEAEEEEGEEDEEEEEAEEAEEEADEEDEEAE